MYRILSREQRAVQVEKVEKVGEQIEAPWWVYVGEMLRSELNC
jgi:hypothetical protein